MKRTETKTIEVTYCDYCGAETADPQACALCGREACGADGYGKHFAFALEVYSYSDDSTSGWRSNPHICRECAVELDPNSDLRALLEKR